MPIVVYNCLPYHSAAHSTCLSWGFQGQFCPSWAPPPCTTIVCCWLSNKSINKCWSVFTWTRVGPSMFMWTCVCKHVFMSTCRPPTECCHIDTPIDELSWLVCPAISKLTNPTLSHFNFFVDTHISTSFALINPLVEVGLHSFLLCCKHRRYYSTCLPLYTCTHVCCSLLQAGIHFCICSCVSLGHPMGTLL